jgi:hypothetical protein
MLETALIPEKTIISIKGDSAPADLSGAASRVFLLTLDITSVVEQESIEVSIWGSADAQTWSAKPLMAFPQKFYCGQTPLLLDLTSQPDVQLVRAHWEVNRWGRGTEAVMFEAGLTIREVPAALLAREK